MKDEIPLWAFGLALVALFVIIGAIIVTLWDGYGGLVNCQDACKGASKYNFTYGETVGLCPKMNTGQYECCSMDYYETPSGGLWSNCKRAVDEMAECERLNALIGRDVDCEELIA